MTKAFTIAKGPRETHSAYVIRKLRQAHRDGVKFAVLKSHVGSGLDIYADIPGEAFRLLVIVNDRKQAAALFNKIGAHVPGYTFACA